MAHNSLTLNNKRYKIKVGLVPTFLNLRKQKGIIYGRKICYGA